MNYLPAFPKPGQIRKVPVVVKVFRDGREKINLNCKAGRDEYVRRKHVMFNRQGKQCGLIISPQCKERNGRWPLTEIQFGHDVSRGGGKQDDRIEVDGKPKNHALCSWCNSMQVSQPITNFLDAI